MTASLLYLWGYGVRGLSFNWLMEAILKERPILFSGAMVRALLSGSKTQTRRAIKGIEITDGNVPGSFHYEVSKAKEGFDAGRNMTQADLNTSLLGIIGHCPYGQPGDRLWVRETWKNYFFGGGGVNAPGVRYAADNTTLHRTEASQVTDKVWRPSIFMPRWASRLLLEITAVRCERLQNISEADALTEGVDMRQPAYYETGSLTMIGDHNRGIEKIAQVTGARAQYAWLWNNINGPRAWESNPWVWVVEFKIIKS